MSKPPSCRQTDALSGMLAAHGSICGKSPLKSMDINDSPPVDLGLGGMLPSRLGPVTIDASLFPTNCLAPCRLPSPVPPSAGIRGILGHSGASVADRPAAEPLGADHADPATPRQAPAAAEPLAVEAAVAARLCGISRTLWYDLRAAGRLPEPIRLGRRVLWRVEELRAWVFAGCPSLHRWQAIKWKP